MKKLPVLFFLLFTSTIIASHVEAQLGLFSSSLKKGEVYRALDGDTLRIVSKDEAEDEHGLVGKYTVEGDKVRVVVNALGTTHAVYYKITKEGLEKEKGRKILYSSANYDTAVRRAEEARMKREQQAKIERDKREREAQIAKEKAQRETLLIEAAGKGDVALVKDLIAKGTDVNIKDREGNTPIMPAAGWNRVEVIKALLSKGASINAKNRYSDTALMRASKYGHVEAVQALLAAGALINEKNNGNQSALMIAIKEQKPEVAKLLISKGADINVTITTGEPRVNPFFS